MAYTIYLDKKESLLNFRVKDKRQIINIWLDISEKLLNNMYEISDSIPSVRKEVVHLIEQNYCWRAYILDEVVSSHKKIVIISFPFKIRPNVFEGTELESISLTYQNNNISHKEISMIRSVLNYMFDNIKPLPIYDAIIEVLTDIGDAKEGCDLFLSNVIAGLLSFNDGYIRYDYDPEHVNGDIHPLYHLDIFFSKGVTFKIGLTRKYEAKDLVDLLEQNSSCKYLNDIVGRY